MKKFSKEYRDYIESVEWAEKRAEALRYYDNECQKGAQAKMLGFYGDHCKGPLHVHHRHYRTLGDESMEDLTVLCRKHHKRHHIKKDITKFMKALRDA